MGTKVYGMSDDLIEFEGDIYGEHGNYGTDDRDKGVLFVASDGSIFEFKYCKHHSGVWGVSVIKEGDLLDYVKTCDDSEADIYSDIVHFKDGLKWVYACDEWSEVN